MEISAQKQLSTMGLQAGTAELAAAALPVFLLGVCVFICKSG